MFASVDRTTQTATAAALHLRDWLAGVGGSPPMKENTKERWTKLCEQAAVEQDSERLIALVEEINRTLEEGGKPLKHEHSEE